MSETMVSGPAATASAEHAGAMVAEVTETATASQERAPRHQPRLHGYGPGDPIVTSWRELTARHAAACAALDHALGERHGLCVSDYEVLERLAEHDEHKARSQDLAEAVHLSQSALSRLVDRLAKHGLVERCVCEFDRRGVYVALTAAGARRHAEALPTHREVLADVLAIQAEGAAVGQQR